MKKKEKNALSGFGIGSIVVLGIIMIVHFYLKIQEQPFYMRILEGALRFGLTFIGTGLIYLVLMIAMYGAIHALKYIYKESDDEDNYTESFMHLWNPIFIICYIVSYMIIFFEM